MLLDGIAPSLLDRFDLKVKAGIPTLNAEVSRRQLEPGRFARAERLCAALDAQGRIGSVFDEDSEFFREQILAAWGFWNRKDGGYADVVYFSGFIDDNTFVGLGGSAYHTLERASDRIQQYSNSGLQALMAFLKERSEAPGSQGSYRRIPPGAWDSDSWDADHDNSVVPEPVEFVAQRLLDYGYPHLGVRAIIGSPIYVARTGRPTTRRTLKEYEAVRNRHAIYHYLKPRLQPRHGRREIGKPSRPQPAPLQDPNVEQIDTLAELFSMHSRPGAIVRYCHKRAREIPGRRVVIKGHCATRNHVTLLGERAPSTACMHLYASGEHPHLPRTASSAVGTAGPGPLACGRSAAANSAGQGRRLREARHGERPQSSRIRASGRRSRRPLASLMLLGGGNRRRSGASCAGAWLVWASSVPACRRLRYAGRRRGGRPAR
jgi:Family of unknown function (DUF7019)